jgi:hypothetical protein
MMGSKIRERRKIKMKEKRVILGLEKSPGMRVLPKITIVPKTKRKNPAVFCSKRRADCNLKIASSKG